MTVRKFAFAALSILAFTLPAYAGGGAGGAAGATGTGGTAASQGQTGGTSDNPAANQPSSSQGQQIEENERNAATTGSNTRPSSSSDSGVVSAPGVGVGHAANGLPIGSPGSGLGSPEQSEGPSARTQ
jgi:hypothetical protein